MSVNNDCLPLPHIRDPDQVAESCFSYKQPLAVKLHEDSMTSEETQRSKLPVLEPRVHTDSLHYWRAGLDKKLTNSYLSSVEKGYSPSWSSSFSNNREEPHPISQDDFCINQSAYLSHSLQYTSKVDFSKQGSSLSMNSASVSEKKKSTATSSRSSSDNEPGEERVAEYYKGPVFMAISRNTDNRRHLCEVCQKRFSRPSSLKTHMYTHTGEKPFICVYEGCSKRFSVESNLRRHLRLHVTPATEGNPLEEP